jgi:hypothetical protein
MGIRDPDLGKAGRGGPGFLDPHDSIDLRSLVARASLEKSAGFIPGAFDEDLLEGSHIAPLDLSGDP